MSIFGRGLARGGHDPPDETLSEVCGDIRDVAIMKKLFYDDMAEPLFVEEGSMRYYDNEQWY
jgi:hypothetical protein